MSTFEWLTLLGTIVLAGYCLWDSDRKASAENADMDRRRIAELKRQLECRDDLDARYKARDPE